ncbi:DinB family protein [Amycolatopsis antarctica]|uniref:DinB family protein n=1 Tax=Amycolatopsis antarctica TaxID=1854586 RepID=A0A263CZY3_9PSEU|nr:maleylpyruvate isomerase family mycothiol-dependent enzyme [Amycolatopsis antarctica]OZM70665.1 DinB family protein [Amycolatopsis antarctica]
MSRTDVMSLAEAERQDLADFLDTLATDDWQAPTLCSDWTAHQVVAHVISFEELSRPQLVARFVKGWLGPGNVNSVGVREYVTRSPSELIALVRAYALPRGLTAGFGGAIALTDGLIHHQDIRRSLKQPRSIPPERLVAALQMAVRAPTLPARRNTRGLRLVAIDIDWDFGQGPEVTGSGEALLMAIAGRPAALADLHGPGLDTLAARLPSP